MVVLVILTALSFPLTVFSWISLFGGGIWLAILGQWSAIGWGMLGFGISHFVLGLALMPGLLFSAPAAYLYDRFKPLAYVLGFLGTIYTLGIITLWCVYVFHFFAFKAESMNTLTPLLLWSYGVATGPLGYMASKEGPDRVGSVTATVFAEIGYIVMICLVLFSTPSSLDLTVIFALIMLVGFCCQLAIARFERRFRGA